LTGRFLNGNRGKNHNFKLFFHYFQKNHLPRGSITSRPHLADLDEGELFMELIRDVANELDIDVLCHKILVNVGLLTCADRGSLFLAKGAETNRYLVAKLFDVTQDTGE
jgi:cGMP-specific 3',5'-cyclic phosphodiesterase, invertebrate